MPLTNRQKFFKERSRQKWFSWKELDRKSDLSSRDEQHKRRLCREIKKCHDEFLACRAQPLTGDVTDEDFTDDEGNSLPMYLLITEPSGRVVCTMRRPEQWDQLVGDGYHMRRERAQGHVRERGNGKRLVNRHR